LALKSLNQLKWLRLRVVVLRRAMLKWRWGIDLHPSASVSLTSRFVNRQRHAISVGAETLIAFKTLLISHDARSGQDRPIRIGRRCFIGGGSLISPGVTIGDECIVAAGSVVVSDVPTGCIVAGNPARILRRNISVGPYGRLAGADENSRRLWR
jgi:acetyltransferase-like isoleucine patch superfamily enzyme